MGSVTATREGGYRLHLNALKMWQSKNAPVVSIRQGSALRSAGAPSGVPGSAVARGGRPPDRQHAASLNDGPTACCLIQPREAVRLDGR